MSLGANDYDILIEEDADVRLPDGTLVCAFRRWAIAPFIAGAAAAALDNFRQIPWNRGTAVIGKGASRPVRLGGRVSKTREIDTQAPEIRGIDSGIVGFYERVIRTPYCRPCAWNARNPERWQKVVRLAQEVDRVFFDGAPERYMAQSDYAAQFVREEWMIPKTAFSTITVNRNFRTRVHKDAGDYAPGFGTLTVARSGKYAGAYFVMPTLRPRVAFDMQTGDVLLSDVHQWHGNTPIEGIPGRFERVSFVFYLRSKMVGCLSPVEELRQAQRRGPGQPLFP